MHRIDHLRAGNLSFQVFFVKIKFRVFLEFELAKIGNGFLCVKNVYGEVVKNIEHHRKTHGELPAAMLAVYEYLHKRHIEKFAEARHYQDIYKSM